MRTVFCDKALENNLTHKGYAIIHQLLNPEELRELELFIEHNPLNDSRLFTISNWNKDKEYSKKINNQIIKVLSPAANRYISNYRPVMGVLAFKQPGTNSALPMHQDWSLVDEEKYRSVSIWVAVTEMNEETGTIQIIKGSHKYANYPRGINTGYSFSNVQHYLEANHAENIYLKKGDAIIFDHRLIHGSAINNSNEIRIAAVLALIPSEAAFIHYYKSKGKENTYEILAMKEEEFFTLDFFDINNRPSHISKLAEKQSFFKMIELDQVKSFYSNYYE